MKKLILTIAAIFFVSTSAFAGSCEIPKFIKEGNIIAYAFASMSHENRWEIIEIDKKSCWMKVRFHSGNDKPSPTQMTLWVNIKLLTRFSIITQK